MKFWVECEHVGVVKDIDSLAKELGYGPDDVTLVDIDYDVAAIHEYFGKPGKRVGVNEFGGFFVVAQDGDYQAIWGFHGNIAYDHKNLWRIHWKLIDENERRAIKRAIGDCCKTCGGLAITHSAQRDANGRNWNVWCDKKVKADK